MDTRSHPQSPTHLPASSSKYHHPYFTPSEVDFLSDKQRGKLSITQEEKIRQSACAFLEALGTRIGFPRKTIATAQNLYHRFHLFFPRKDFNYLDVSLAALYVSTKMHDTLKKPRDLLAVSYAVRYPELVAKSKHPGGEVDVDNMDQNMVEQDRQRLLAIERLILETICFNFTSRMAFPYVIKIGRAFKATKKLTKLAWRLTIDCHRTLVTIQYPPHVVALASLYVAALLSSFEKPLPPTTSTSPIPNSTMPPGPETQTPHAIAATLGKHGDWERTFQSQIEDLEEIAHTLLDLLIHGLQNPSANTSPTTPSSPHPGRPAHPGPAALEPAPLPYTPDQLIRLKIAMREKRGNGDGGKVRGGASAEVWREDAAMIGRNEGTVRFLFEPRGMGSR